MPSEDEVAFDNDLEDENNNTPFNDETNNDETEEDVINDDETEKDENEEDEPFDEDEENESLNTNTKDVINEDASEEDETVDDEINDDVTDEEELEDEEEDVIFVDDLLDSIIEPENIKSFVVNECGEESCEQLFEGSFDDLPEDISDREFVSFNVAGGHLVVNVNEPEDPDEVDSVADFLEFFDDAENDQVAIVDVETSEELGSGTKEEVIEKFGNLEFVAIEAPERLVINVATDIEDADKNNVDEAVKKNNTRPYSLFEKICMANNLAAYRVDNYRSQEHWINETLEEGDEFDLKTIYEVYVKGTSKALEKEFKLATGYRETFVEDLNEDDPTDLVPVEDDAEEYDGPIEILPAEDTPDTTAVVPADMSDTEVSVLREIGRIAGDISEAIETTYGIQADPQLIVADIIRDLKLINGDVDISELGDSPIDQATANMFNDYTATYGLVDNIMSMLTGQEFHTTSDMKLRQALRSLYSPAFSKTNIEKGIASTQFLQAARAGQVPYIGTADLPMLENLNESVAINEADDDKEEEPSDEEPAEEENTEEVTIEDVPDMEPAEDMPEEGTPEEVVADAEEVVPEENNIEPFNNEPPVDPVVSLSRDVMSSYQNANKWLDSIKEAVYTRMNCPFFSSFIHTLAHTMPGRFDKFGDILHTANMEIPYPSTSELANIPSDISDTFTRIFECLDNIKTTLTAFIRVTDDNNHGMSCAAEGLLNDIEEEYPMLYRLQGKWQECNGDSVAFDKYVMQYVEHKDDLLENVNPVCPKCKKNPCECDKQPEDKKPINEIAPIVATAVAAAASGAGSTIADRICDKVLGEDADDDVVVDITGEDEEEENLNESYGWVPALYANDLVSYMRNDGIKSVDDLEVDDFLDYLRSQEFRRSDDLELVRQDVVDEVIPYFERLEASEQPAMNSADREFLNWISSANEGFVSYRTRKELSEAIEDCINNNKPFSVRRSVNEGFRFDLVEAVESDEEEENGTNTESKEETKEVNAESGAEEKTDAKEKLEEEVDAPIKVQDFDNQVNQYFNENYETTVVYTTYAGFVNDEGNIILEGLVESGDTSRNVKFILTPNSAINESVESTDVETEQALGLKDYKVTNDLSDETFEFKFINDTPAEEIQDNYTMDKEAIIKDFEDDTHLVYVPEMIDILASWEFYRKENMYKELGFDESHVKNLLVSAVENK